MQERTLSIIKPDGVEKGVVGRVITCFEQAGFKIVGMKMVRLSKAQAESFYEEHRGQPYFDGLNAFMVSGPSVVMVLEGEDAIQIAAVERVCPSPGGGQHVVPDVGPGQDGLPGRDHDTEHGRTISQDPGIASVANVLDLFFLPP